MTIKYFWKHCVPNVKNKAPLPFKVAEGTATSVDISFVTCLLFKRPESAVLMSCSLPYPPNDVTDMISSNYKAMLQNNVKPYCVFDGCKHPMKAETNDNRSKLRLDSEDKLKLFCEKGKDNTVELTKNIIFHSSMRKRWHYPRMKLQALS